MKLLKFVVVGTAILAFGYVQAQEMSHATQATQPAVSAMDSVGGVAGTTSDAGASMGKTRAQVYQELLHARQSGELDRLKFQGR